jgi:ribonuclease-3
MVFLRRTNLPSDREKKLEELEAKIGVRIKDLELLHIATIHKSYTKANNLPSSMCNERLEFVGDAFISMVISKHLYFFLPNASEGELSSIKSDVVSRSVMYDIGDKLALQNYILSFPPITKYSDRGVKTIISNTVEAIVGAYLVSNGILEAEKMVLNLFRDIVERRIKEGSRDYKSKLQMLAVKFFGEYPEYNVKEVTGPDHAREYVVEVNIGGKRYGLGKGKSKKAAEQEAAKETLKSIDTESINSE